MAKGVRGYLMLTFFCAWFLWGIVGIGTIIGIKVLSFNQPLAMVLYALGGMSPGLSALYMAKRIYEPQNFKGFLLRLFSFKLSPWLYLYGLGGAICIHFIPFWLGGYEMTKPFYWGLILIVPMIVGGGLEEIGWRGFLQSKLQEKMPLWKVNLIVGSLWAIWHLPLWFITGTNQSQMNFLWFFVFIMAGTFFLGSVYHQSKSILLVVLSHATINAFWEVFPPHQNLMVAIIEWVAVYIICIGINQVVTKLKDKKIKPNAYEV